MLKVYNADYLEVIDHRFLFLCLVQLLPCWLLWLSTMILHTIKTGEIRLPRKVMES